MDLWRHQKDILKLIDLQYKVSTLRELTFENISQHSNNQSHYICLKGQKYFTIPSRTENYEIFRHIFSWHQAVQIRIQGNFNQVLQTLKVQLQTSKVPQDYAQPMCIVLGYLALKVYSYTSEVPRTLLKKPRKILICPT